jgi:hypothetical protein
MFARQCYDCADSMIGAGFGGTVLAQGSPRVPFPGSVELDVCVPSIAGTISPAFRRSRSWAFEGPATADARSETAALGNG